MDIILKNAYTEVNQVIELLGEPYKKKIPKQIINFFYENRNINYKANISKNIPIEDIEISRTALIIISILNLKYWETDENKKEELKNIYNKNEKKFQGRISKYKQKDWLKTEKIESQDKFLIEKKNISLIYKIKRFFRKLIHFKEKSENK